MDEQLSLWAFVQQQKTKILEQTVMHIGLTAVALLLAIIAGVVLGILISRKPKLAGATLGIAGVLQTVPSIALLGFMIPLLGIGAKPAIAALFLYALLPIIRNTYTGLTSINAAVLESAYAVGMTNRQVLWKVQLPLAMPVILAGIRTATVITVGVATLAAYIAAGGLGEFIFGGIALNNKNMILAGAIPAALLALLLDWLLSRVQRLNMKKMRYVTFSMPLVIILLSLLYLAPATASGKLLVGFTPEFMGRYDGYLGLRKVYGMDVRTVVINDMIMYKAAGEKQLDVISGSTTDGRVQAYDLVALADDKHIFPPYYAAPLVNKTTLERYPTLEPVLNKLAGKINDSLMTAMNYRVDYKKEDPEKVAKDFLITSGLYRPAAGQRNGQVIIGAKMFGDGYVLAPMYKMLIEGYTQLEAVTKTGLGGTQICFDALVNHQIDLYPEYTGTGLLVLLKTPPAISDSLMPYPDKVYNYVAREFSARFGLQWMQPVGFNNTYALMMRRQQSYFLGVRTISDLKNYLDKQRML
ncbi:osmoprotectant transport system permease protein [Filimonas lacunae]|uniref:Osmoprotectant transport system permease protein n=1 Tax=Filimonas lacunae TaxID=477680 RepID=A0A173MFH1_9BACT|nr:ABC transporter permease/substrate-binding protein [Filimonas lacunae]BAV06364.1 L-proline glycine betaine binding ABC transporter protein [Filimonas lacunae]SIT26634.1 osmoprotectant transport system permease protein [Filimonas lacunae]